MSVSTLLRFAGALLVGLLTITLVVEPLEFGLVTLLAGGVESDPEVYFGIRNRPAFVAAKVVYNAVGGVLGGYVAARLAGRKEHLVGGLLACVQAGALLWAMNDPELGRHTPVGIWALIILATVTGVVVGATLRARRARPGRVKAPAS